jgi:hypothetical protein
MEVIGFIYLRNFQAEWRYKVLELQVQSVAWGYGTRCSLRIQRDQRQNDDKCQFRPICRFAQFSHQLFIFDVVQRWLV